MLGHKGLPLGSEEVHGMRLPSTQTSSRATWNLVPALPLASCVTLEKAVALSGIWLGDGILKIPLELTFCVDWLMTAPGEVYRLRDDR